MPNEQTQRRKDYERPQSQSESVNNTAGRHQRTGAARTTTAETVEPRRGPTPAEINARQKADAERDKAARTGTALTPISTALVSTTALAPVTSSAALERNLAECAGPAGRMIGFNGQIGIHRTLDDDVEVEMPARYTSFFEALQRGFIQFREGEPPIVRMRGIAEEGGPVTRESLGDLDEGTWPISQFTDKPTDPWQFQYVFPIVADGPGNELFLYVARGVVATKSVGSLLGAWRWHPKRKAGLLPIVEISNGTYPSKRFQSDRPKPILKIVDWVSPAGEAPAAKAIAAAERAEFNDDVGF
jgi:hypothetical protein